MNVKYVYSSEAIASAVSTSFCMADVLRKLGIKISGGSHSYLSKRIKKEGFSTSHFTGQRWNVGKTSPKRLSATQILVIGRSLYREKAHKLRRALLELGVENKCNRCSIPPVWNGKPLTFEVNHKNCDFLDNSKDNLEFVCPNCHAQFTYDCLQERKPS